MIETRQKETKLENKTIEAIYHKLYYEVIDQKVKQDQNLHEQGLDLGKTGPANFDYKPSHLDPQMTLKCKTDGTLGDYMVHDIPEDIIRARHSSTGVPAPRCNQYTNRPI